MSGSEMIMYAGIAIMGVSVLFGIVSGDVVLDIFGGSGSTLIACEQLNRCCYMVEKEPVYCQIIINRWEEYTGLKAEKIG